ncbi:MAG: carboxymuconolactone decarboxylase family protein [Moorea sp. SIOASIH]|uniref:carboxymuconolactone decarboxylase family protein n=1 Tax=Moorena sp. SIOASIH TaxID=2607817 RepID=UPI0013B874B1|nr:carboxymuconolactone decarboxylase family protein [Moorena sp. SIOASIH]NEO41276.1 carboxymuconolactone decarboxylase family protein [Moorena sp. SIOASIH]
MTLEAETILEQIRQSIGIVPNALQAMSEEPSLLKAYTELEALLTHCSLSNVEQELVILTISVANECEYCVAAHSVASKKISADQIHLLRNHQPLSDSKLQVLRETTEGMVHQRGHLSEQEISKFIEAGYTHSQLLAIVLIIAFKILTNYSNHINHPDLDNVFMDQKWQVTA